MWSRSSLCKIEDKKITTGADVTQLAYTSVKTGQNCWHPCSRLGDCGSNGVQQREFDSSDKNYACSSDIII